MAHSLSMEVTHVASYLENFKRFCLTMTEKSSKVFQDITNMNPNEEDYNDKVRKAIKKYDEVVGKYYQHEKDEFELFIKDITDIRKHKNDENVIYSIRSYASMERELKEIKKKKIKKLKETIEDSRLYAKADGDYVIALAYANILNYLENTYDKIDQVIGKLNKITNLKEKDDDEDK